MKVCYTILITTSILLVAFTTSASALEPKSNLRGAVHPESGAAEKRVPRDPSEHVTDDVRTRSNACPATNVGVLTSGSTIVGSTLGSTDNFVAGCGSNPGGQDQIFEFSVDPCGVWTFDSCTVPASWDTTLEIREETGGSCPGDFVACDGDGCDVGVYESAVAAFLTTGTTYYLIVDGWSTFAYGEFTITAALTSPSCTSDAECDDGVFCNGSETCNVATGQCLDGANPCTTFEGYTNVCDDQLDQCVKAADCFTWIAGAWSGTFFAQGNNCLSLASWVFDDVQSSHHTTGVLDFYTTPIVARSTPPGASPLGTSFSVDQALFTVDAGTCSPLAEIAGSQCTSIATVDPDGSPIHDLPCSGTMPTLPDNSGDFNRCEIDFYLASRTAQNGAGMPIAGQKPLLGGPAAADEFGVSVIWTEDCPPSGVYDATFFGDDVNLPADFATAVVCQKPQGTCCAPDGSCSLTSVADCAAIGGIFGNTGTTNGRADCVDVDCKVEPVTLSLVPVGADGSHSIAGNEITLTGGGQRVEFDLLISGWTPESLSGYEVTIDPTGFSSLNGIPAMEQCDTDAECVAVFGSGVGNVCQDTDNDGSGDTCIGSLIDVARADYLFAGLPTIAAVDRSDPLGQGLRYISAVLNPFDCVIDPGVPRYIGTLFVDVPDDAVETTTSYAYDALNRLVKICDGTDLNPVGANPGIITVNPAPVACCLGDGSCIETLPDDCKAQGGIPGGPRSECEGDLNGNGVDEACDNDIRTFVADTTTILTMETPDGLVKTPADLVLEFTVGPEDNGVAPVSVRVLNIVSDSLNIAGNDTGLLGLMVTEQGDGTLDAATGAVSVPVQLSAWYAFIDTVAPPVPEAEDGPVAQNEVFEGALTGTLSLTPGAENFSGSLGAAATTSLTGLISSVAFDAGLSPIALTDRTARFPCADPKLRCREMKISIQPVFLQNAGGGAMAGISWPLARFAAARLWKHCCIWLEFKDPLVWVLPVGWDINALTVAQFNAIATGVGAPAGQPAVPRRCIPVFIFGDFAPAPPVKPSGGARVNAVGRGPGCRVVYADNATLGWIVAWLLGRPHNHFWAANWKVLAHELGHCFGLCHPGCAACPPAKGPKRAVNQATPGSVMRPTGGCFANAWRVKWLDCLHAMNVLMRPTPIRCCKWPVDIRRRIPHFTEYHFFNPGGALTTNPLDFTPFEGDSPHSIQSARANSLAVEGQANVPLPSALSLDAATGSLSGIVHWTHRFPLLCCVFNSRCCLVAELWWKFVPHFRVIHILRSGVQVDTGPVDTSEFVGEGPFTFSPVPGGEVDMEGIVNDDLPKGLIVDPNTGAMIGTAPLGGVFHIACYVFDAKGRLIALLWWKIIIDDGSIPHFKAIHILETSVPVDTGPVDTTDFEPPGPYAFEMVPAGQIVGGMITADLPPGLAINPDTGAVTGATGVEAWFRVLCVVTRRGTWDVVAFLWWEFHIEPRPWFPNFSVHVWDISAVGIWRREVRTREVARWYQHYDWLTVVGLWLERRAEGVWIWGHALSSFNCHSHCFYQLPDGRVYRIWRWFRRVDILRFRAHYRVYWTGWGNPVIREAFPNPEFEDPINSRFMLSIDDLQITLPMEPQDPDPTTPFNENVQIMDENGVTHFLGEPGFEIAPDTADNPDGFRLATTAQSTDLLPPAAERMQDLPPAMEPGMVEIAPGVMVEWLSDDLGNEPGGGPVDFDAALAGQKHQGLIGPPTKVDGNVLTLDQGNNVPQLYSWELDPNGEVLGALPGQTVIGPPVDLDGDGLADGPEGAPIPMDPTVRDENDVLDPTARPVEIAIVEEDEPTQAELDDFNALLIEAGLQPIFGPFKVCIKWFHWRRLWTVSRRTVMDVWDHHWQWVVAHHFWLRVGAYRVWLTNAALSSFGSWHHHYVVGQPPVWTHFTIVNLRWFRVCYRIYCFRPNQLRVKIDQLWMVVPIDPDDPDSDLMLLTTESNENALPSPGVLAGIDPDPLPVDENGVLIEPLDPLSDTLDMPGGGTGIFSGDATPLGDTPGIPQDITVVGNEDLATALKNNQLQLYCWRLDRNGNVAKEDLGVIDPMTGKPLMLTTGPTPSIPVFDDGKGVPQLDPTMISFNLVATVCGDGNLELGEQCDDGNTDNGDGCDENCVLEECGNNVHQPGAGEECDGTDDAACPGGCQADCTCNFGACCTQDNECIDGLDPTTCEIKFGGTSQGDGTICGGDCNANGIPDGCEPDCNGNGIPDECDIASGESPDVNGNGIPDECEGVVSPIPALPPHHILKNRYISVDVRGENAVNPPTLKVKVTMTASVAPGADGIGLDFFAGAPDAQCISVVTQVDQGVVDWSGCDVVHLTGCGIIPTSTYDVTVEDDQGTESPALSAETQARPGIKWHSDCVGSFSGTEWSGPNGQTNIDDAVAAIKTFQNPSFLPGCATPPCNATHTSVTDVAPNLTVPVSQINKIVNIEDVLIIILGFGGQVYPGVTTTNCD